VRVFYCSAKPQPATAKSGKPFLMSRAEWRGASFSNRLISSVNGSKTTHLTMPSSGPKEGQCGLRELVCIP